MKRSLFITSLCLSFVSSCAASVMSNSTAIYDEDRRVFPDETLVKSHPYIQTIALLTRKQNVIEQNAHSSTLRQRRLGDTLRLCTSDPLYNQDLLGDCSGFAIDQHHLVTARHCIPNQAACDERVFVFNVHKQRGNTFNNREVRTCKRIVSAIEREQGDLVLIELSSPIAPDAHVRFLKPVSNDVNSQNVSSHIIAGHPFGSVLTISPLESTLKIENEFFALGRADVSQGSSGSPLFNEKTGEIHGILVGGEYDLVWDERENCNKNRNCQGDVCEGERFSRAHVLLSLIKNR